MKAKERREESEGRREEQNKVGGTDGRGGRKGWSDGGKGDLGFVFSCLLMELEIQKSNAMYLDFL